MNSPDNRPDNTFEQRARSLYREASQRLDPATAGRLRAARRRALEVAQAPRQHTHRWLIPAGAFAAIALAALMVWRPLPHQGGGPMHVTASSAAADTDLDNELPPDAAQTDPDLYQNLDFYGWLAANNQPARR